MVDFAQHMSARTALARMARLSAMPSASLNCVRQITWSPQFPIGMLRTADVRRSLIRAFQGIPDRQFAQEIGQWYRRSAPLGRVRLLTRLLRSIGPMGTMAVAAGAFARFAVRKDWNVVALTEADTTRITAEQVEQLVLYLVQADPHVFETVANLLVQDLSSVSLLGTPLIERTLAHLHQIWDTTDVDLQQA